MNVEAFLCALNRVAVVHPLVFKFDKSFKSDHCANARQCLCKLRWQMSGHVEEMKLVRVGLNAFQRHL